MSGNDYSDPNSLGQAAREVGMLDMGRPVKVLGTDRKDPERLSRLSALLVTVALSLALWLVTVYALQVFFG